MSPMKISLEAKAQIKRSDINIIIYDKSLPHGTLKEYERIQKVSNSTALVSHLSNIIWLFFDNSLGTLIQHAKFLRKIFLAHN